LSARAWRGAFIADPSSVEAAKGYVDAMTRLGRRSEALTMLEAAARAGGSEIIEFLESARTAQN
jgi:hypothetical protein